MTNYEYYKEQIERIARMGVAVAFDNVTKEICRCDSSNCGRCLFIGGDCEENALKWADEEYKGDNNKAATSWEEIYDDIVKQYRDEIAALKDENRAQYSEHLKLVEGYRNKNSEIEKLKSEITQLKAENTALRTDRDYWLGKSQALSEKLIGKE